MKELIILIAVIVSILLSTLLFYNKYHNKKTDIDIIKSDLQEFDDILKPGSCINCIIIPHELGIYASLKYSIAPVSVYLNTSGREFDTSLYIVRSIAGDSELSKHLFKKKVIKDYEGEAHRYIIAVNE